MTVSTADVFRNKLPDRWACGLTIYIVIVTILYYMLLTIYISNNTLMYELTGWLHTAHRKIEAVASKQAGVQKKEQGPGSEKPGYITRQLYTQGRILVSVLGRAISPISVGLLWGWETSFRIILAKWYTRRSRRRKLSSFPSTSGCSFP